MSTITYDSSKDGSHIQFFTKEQVMMCSQDLIMRQSRNPMSLKGIKLPKGMEIIGGIEFLRYAIKYYGILVGTIDIDTFDITYRM